VPATPAPATDVFAPLRPIRDAWARIVRLPARRVVLAAAALAVVVAFSIARRGTTQARVAAALVLVAGFGAAIAWQRVRARRLRDTRWVIASLVGSVEPDAASRLARALTLIDGEGDARDEGTSPELARLHLERSVAAVPEQRVLEGAVRAARRLGGIGLALAVAAFVAAVIDPWAVLEGAVVLVARRGVAPMSMQWIEDVDLRARPPEYLHMEEGRLFAAKVDLPRGTLLTLRGRPTHVGRHLLLSDGKTEIPFIDDGSGRVVARWPLGESADLRVVARFGDVVIGEGQATAIVSIPDRAPAVKLEGAPLRIALGGDAEVTEIPIRYEATDDHGLREVHLVLRSGPREERRVLAKLDGETKSDRGGYVLRATDAFVKKSNAPIEIVVEAKDNDPITGPKWGASAAITLVPPHVGEPEARRIESLERVRDALVDRLAWRVDKPIPAAGDARKAYVSELVEAADADDDLIDSVLSASYAGLRVPGRLQAMLRAQSRKLDDAVRVHARTTSPATLAALVKQNERFVLVVDATVRGLGSKDARAAAKRLVDVAEDLATELGMLDSIESKKAPTAVPRRVAHADAAVGILTGSATTLRRMGSLGTDLGGAIDAALLRVGRARRGSDLPHAELASRDLVARLRHPDPSFGSQGSGSRAGGESGGGRGVMGEGDDEEGSDVERAFNEAARELDELIGDHARQKGETEQSMSGVSPEDLAAFAEEAKKHAEAVRQATENMPTVGGGSDSWTSKGAAAREHAEQMARSLEQPNPADALSSGKSALQALEEAKRLVRGDRFSRFGFSGDLDPEKRLDDAAKKLEPEIKWTEDRLEQMRKHSAERASGDLQRSGDAEQKLAERMEQLAQEGKEKGALPSPAIESLESAERAARDAARALRETQGDKALERQGEAQRMLEMAREAMGDDSQGQGPDGGHGGDDGPLDMSHTDIPKADAHKGPEEFRRRVIQGLGQPSSGRLKDAVRRYAEGLLR
jgi:hypothetical protein